MQDLCAVVRSPEQRQSEFIYIGVAQQTSFLQIRQSLLPALCSPCQIGFAQYLRAVDRKGTN